MLISRDSFFAPEIDIFMAVRSWIEANPDVSADDQLSVLSVVRLPLMSLNELLTIVRPTGLLSPETILDAIELQTVPQTDKISYRGLLRKYFFKNT